MKAKTTLSTVCASVAAAACMLAFAPVSYASESETVTSVKSFPAVTKVDKSLTAEATSTDVEKDSKWGSIESLDVPQTKSQAEKDAEAKAKAEAQAQAEAANRNQQRQSLTTTQNSQQNTTQQQDTSSQQAAQPTTQQPTTTTTVGSGASAAIAARAIALVGSSGMDCTALVSAALAAAGISFHGWPSQYASLGTAVSMSQAQPGDILIWGNAHVAVYIGNGWAVHGGWNFAGQVVEYGLWVNTSAGWSNPSQVIHIG